MSAIETPQGNQEQACTEYLDEARQLLTPGALHSAGAPLQALAQLLKPFDQQLCLVLEQLAMADRRLEECQAELRRLLADLHTSLQARSNGAVKQQERAMQTGLPALRPAPVARLAPTCGFDIRCLGHFVVYYDGQQLALPNNRKATGVLKYLALHSERPASRDVLMRLGWPDATPATALNDLNTTISILRNCLSSMQSRRASASPILYETGHYSLNPKFSWRIDVVDFDACYWRGLLHERRGCEDEAMQHYQAAVDLYRGDLEDDWTMVERERLASIFLMVLIKLGSYCLDRGQSEEAMHYAYRLLKHEPCREDAHRLLMRCFSRLQQRTQALHQYDLCRTLLRRELDIEPAAETANLRRRIERGEPV